ncbi:MAG: EI24 domain-containing protein [Bacteroidetes bacterium]|nr:EI24 domain-containing protein [Bacteroidota bacterium]
MNFFRGFFRGIANCFRGFTLIFDKGLWPYMLYPLLLWMLFWVFGILTFAGLAHLLADKLSEQFRFQDIPDSGEWYSFLKPFLTGYFSVIVTWILKVLFFFVSGTFTKYLLLIIMSPLFARVSELTEEKITGKSYPFVFSGFLKDIWRGIGISLRNMLLEYLIIIACFTISILFAPAAFITTPFLLFVSWYYFGFTMLDYNFERHGMNISKSTRFARRNMGLACGIGIVYAFFISLPTFVGDIIGIMLGPLLAVVGATTSFLELKAQDTDEATA